MRVNLSSHFRSYTAGKPAVAASGSTLGEALLDLDRQFPGPPLPSRGRAGPGAPPREGVRQRHARRGPRDAGPRLRRDPHPRGLERRVAGRLPGGAPRGGPRGRVVRGPAGELIMAPRAGGPVDSPPPAPPRGPSEGLHGSHLREAQDHDVRAVGPAGEAVRPDREGDRDRGQEGQRRPRQQSPAAARDAERARREHAEGQGRGRDPTRLRPGRRRLPGDPLRGVRPARRSRSSSRRRPTTRPAPSPTSGRTSRPTTATSATWGASRTTSSAWASSGSRPRGSTPTSSSSR